MTPVYHPTHLLALAEIDRQLRRAAVDARLSVVQRLYIFESAKFIHILLARYRILTRSISALDASSVGMTSDGRNALARASS